MAKRKAKQLRLLPYSDKPPPTPKQLEEMSRAGQRAREELEEMQREQDRRFYDEPLARGELWILELPLSPGSLGRGGRITTYNYCNETAFRNFILRLQGVEPPQRRPADRCMHHRPHNCFRPEGAANWCYVTGTPPPWCVSGTLPGFEGIFDKHFEPITQGLCCPEAARLLVRELHKGGWTGIELSTESPDREVQGFVRFMNRTMPCLNR
jgi:hypothetical protein